MPGTLDLFDRVDLTAPSEYSSRQGEKISVLQIHHATTTSWTGLRSLMDPGGRTVSSNGGMTNTGILYECVPLSERAFTSATGFDRRCLTVECANTSLGPVWGISAATRTRLAYLAVAMFRAGLLGSLTRAHIIGHYEVPGTYATACPGPDMNLDAIVAEARAIYFAPPMDGALQRRRKENSMYVRGVTDTKTIYNVFTDANGKERLRVCGKAEASFAVLGGLVVAAGDDASLTLLGQEAGYQYGVPLGLPLVRVGDITESSTTGS